MSTGLKLLFTLALLALAACADAPPRTEGRAAAANAEGEEPLCTSGKEPMLTGAAVGGIAIRDDVEDVRRRCAVVGDTTLMLEGQPQPAMRVALGGDTIVAEVVDDQIWRIQITRPGLATSDSLRVGTPVRRLAELPGAALSPGEGQYYLISPTHCGLSFGIEGVPVRARPWTTAELAAMPDSVRVGTILVTGACHVDGGLRILWDTAT